MATINEMEDNAITTTTTATTSILQNNNNGPMNNSNINGHNKMVKSYSTDYIHASSTLKRDPSLQSLSELTGKTIESRDLRVFAGNLGLGPLFHSFTITSLTTADELLKDAIKKFNIEQLTHHYQQQENDHNTTIEYYLAVQGADGDDCILLPQDKPLSIFKTLTASLTTPMPSSQNVLIKKQQEEKQKQQSSKTPTRRKRSSSFGNYDQTNYEEDYVIRFYLHRRIKRAHEQQGGLVYIRVSLYPDDTDQNDATTPTLATNDNNSSSSSYSFFFKSKKKKISPTSAIIKTEIDRIDKILPVSYDSKVGHVINTALEKFHVPDSMADGMDDDTTLQQHAHPFQTLTKYSMFVKNGNGEEYTLFAPDLMGDVLSKHQQNTSDSINSELLFILRKSTSHQPINNKRKPSLPTSPLSPMHHQQHSHNNSRKSSCSSLSVMSSESRRPSILDILMDSPKTASLPFSSENRRRSVHGFVQDRSNSLPAIIHDSKTTTSSSSSQIAGHLSPMSQSVTPSRRSSIISDQLDLSNNSNNNNSMTDLSIHSNDNIYNGTKKRKDSASSFKQHLKRWVGWGSSSSSSSSSSKQKKGKDLTISTSLSTPTANSSQTSLPNPSTPHRQTPISSQSAFVTTESQFSFTKSEALQSNISVTSAPPTSTTFDISNHHPHNNELYHHHQNDSNVSMTESPTSLSSSPLPPPPLSATLPSSTSYSSYSSPQQQQQQVDTIMMIHDANPIPNNSDVITHDLLSSNQIIKNKSDSDISCVSSLSSTSTNISDSTKPSLKTKNSKTMIKHDPITIHHDDSDEDEDEDDDDDDDDIHETASLSSLESDNISMESDDPDVPLQQRRMQSVTITNDDALLQLSKSVHTEKVEIHHFNETTNINQQEEQKEEENKQQQQSSPSSSSLPKTQKASEEFDNDLFFLVTQGVDYLQSREDSKWEEDDGKNRYEFHPWNKSSTDDASIHQDEEKKDHKSKHHRESIMITDSPNSTTLSLNSIHDENNNNNNPMTCNTTELYNNEEITDYDTIGKVLASPPLSPETSQKQLNRSSSSSSTPSPSQTSLPSTNTTTKPPALDDEELKWIVNSHIVF
ncbi:unnamed protein product [Cunninghamella blakesleeana]